MLPLGGFPVFNYETKKTKIKWRTKECDKYSFKRVYLTQ